MSMQNQKQSLYYDNIELVVNGSPYYFDQPCYEPQQMQVCEIIEFPLEESRTKNQQWNFSFSDKVFLAGAFALLTSLFFISPFIVGLF